MEKLLLILMIGMSFEKSLGKDYKWQNVAVDLKPSFRALSVVDDKVAWVGGSQGSVGRSRNGGKIWSIQQVKGFEELEFRSVYAIDSLTAIIANAGSPAHILRTTDGGKIWKSVY